MLLSGKKNLDIFYDNNINFIFDITVLERPTCTGVFGFEDFNFKIINSKLLDPESIFVDTIESGKKIIISGDLSNTGYSYFLNDTRVASNKNKISNKINKFYYDFQSGFLDLNNLKFLGTVNALQFYFPPKITLDKSITGYAINTSNKTLNLKSGNINSYHNFILEQLDTGVYLPNSSGRIIINPSGVNKTIPIDNFNVDLNLFGDFGNFKKTISLSTNESRNFIYSDFRISNTFYSNLNPVLGDNVLAEKQLFYENITGRGIDNSNLYEEKFIELNLNYISGFTGNSQSNIIGSGIANVNFSGEITGQGYLTKAIDIVATGRNPTNYSNYIDKLTETVSSDLIVVSGIIQNQKVNTIVTGKVFGEFFVDFPIPVTLIEEKQVTLSNNIVEFGTLSGITSGLGASSYATGSGIFYYLSGYYFTGQYNHPLRNIPLTGIYEGDTNCYYINNGYYSGGFSGVITGAGELLSNNITYASTGTLSGDLNTRVLQRTISNVLSVPAVATGYVNANVQFEGFGQATGNYLNTNIYGNIIEYTGIKNSNYTGFIDGTGFLISSGVSDLTNKYGEKRPTTYIDFITYEATGNTNNINSPENIINYNYSYFGTGLKLFSGLTNILGYSTQDNIINLTGYIQKTGTVSYEGSGIYLATGLAFSLFSNTFFPAEVTGYINTSNSNYSITTGFTGTQNFNDTYSVRFYGLGTGANDGLIYNEDHPRVGYIIKNYQLNTGVLFQPEDSGVKTITVTKPAIEFIENGVMPNLIRDFSISPPIIVDGSAVWVPSGALTIAGLPGDAETTTLVIPNSGYVNCPWDISGFRNYNCGGTVYHTYESESGFNDWFYPPRVKMLTGYITLTGSGDMNSLASAVGITGNLISGSGYLVSVENFTGMDFDYVTGYQQTISKLRTGQLDGYLFSGWDERIIKRKGDYSVNLTKNVTGLNYSQIEFVYTGLLTGQMNNVLINNNSGYLYTGLYLEKSMSEINLSNYKYSAGNGQIYNLDLVPVSNLSGSGFGPIPCTGYFNIQTGQVFSKNNYIYDSGKFFVTGVNNISNVLMEYSESDLGVKEINMPITGFILNPNILNQNISINNNQIIGTGFVNQTIPGSGFMEAKVYLNYISGDIPISGKASGENLNIKQKDFYISGNALDGKIIYNNIVTGIENGFVYSGYIGEVDAVKDYNYNQDLLITGYLDNPLTYQINFENSYSIATGYYDLESKTINYKNLNYISGKYFGTGILPSNINILYFKTQLKEYKNQNPIEARLSISGKTPSSIPSVININYKKPEVS